MTRPRSRPNGDARSGAARGVLEADRENRSVRSILAALGEETELGPLLDRIVKAACRLIDADHGTIGLVDEEAGCIRPRGGYNMPASEMNAEMPSGVGLAGEVLRTGRAITFERYGDPPYPTRPEMLDHAVLGMPIIWRKGLIGVFGIGRAPRRDEARARS